MILGIDEVGRGPWAGPLVVGAVVLADDTALKGLTDSKKVSAKNRALLDVQIKSTALGWGLGWVGADEIDEIGLSAALKLATIRAVESVNATYHEIIIDGTINFLKETSKGKYVTTMPKADLLIPAVSAASIIAKVARDMYMEEQALVYPGYGFESHVGYGTAKHSAALNQLGVTPLHRKSFAPIAKLLGEVSGEGVDTPVKVTSKVIGDKAEDAVAKVLQDEGYAVVARNWKTKTCEIDIVATKQDAYFFIEVKYRSSPNQGGGVSAVTPKKLQQMQYAAELYTHRHSVKADRRLMVADVAANYSVTILEVL